MYESILVPTDGSDHAVRAARHGLGLARRFDATVHVVTVVDVTAAGGLFDAGGVSPAFVERLEAAARDTIERIEGIADDDRVRSAVLKGYPPTTILEYADDHDVDMIAMGTHGRTGVSRFVVGSVTERVVRQADVPVLAVRRTDRSEWADGYDDVLLPTDGSEAATGAVEHGLAIAERTNARVHAVNVVDVGDAAASPTVTPPSGLIAELESEGKAATETIADRAQDAGLDAVTAVRKGIPSTTLLEYVDEHDIDLVAMGTAGRTGLDRVLLGSTTERLLRHGPVPVLAVRTGEGATE